MSTRTISSLGQRMIDDMTARHPGPRTQQDYVRKLQTLCRVLQALT